MTAANHNFQHGQLFCKNSSKEILDMLLTECRKGRVKIITENTVESVTFDGKQFQILLSSGRLSADKLIVATGGLSLPKTGATPTAYKIADSFDIPIVPVRAGLVPLTLDKPDLDLLEPLSGVSLPVKISLPGISFKEKLLFTHKGLSGPAILQISNYWLPGQILKIDLLPNEDIDTILCEAPPQKQIKTILASYIPKSLCDCLVKVALIPDISVDCLTKEMCQQTADNLHKWCIKPNGTEGYRTAEVTLGGVDVNALSSKTMATTKIKDLYFIGEAVDVTDHLGGYNLQWCWSSAWACADAIKKHDR